MKPVVKYNSQHHQVADSLMTDQNLPSQHLGHVLIVGVGKSGQATARFLCKHADTLKIDSLTLADSLQSDALDAFFEQLCKESSSSPILADLSLRALFGTEQIPSPDDFAHYDLCIITPGLAPHTALAKSAYVQSREVISEVELAWRLSPDTLNWVAITGTNGKTTTTELVRAVLSAKKQEGSTSNHVYSVGNIGTPALELLDQLQPGDTFVAEVSSFQAARLADFRPQVAALLNLSADHLDWHKDIAAYAADKCEIFAHSADGDLILAPDASQLHPESREVIAAALEAARARGAKLRIVDTGKEALPLSAQKIGIQGKHNLTNACFALEIARYFDVAEEDSARALKDFQPPPHRMQEVARLQDVLYVNDSKSTNPDSTMQALSAYVGLELILLLGGQSKGSLGADYLDLARLALGRAQTILLFGQVASELKTVFECVAEDGQGQRVLCFETMEDAVRFACEKAKPCQVVLLSPANTSFDEFANYEERGTVFQKLVEKFGA